MTAKTFPQVRKAALGKTDRSREREWLQQYGHEYTGQWAVLGEGHRIGHTADDSKVADIVIRARAEGIRFPYIKFIDDASEPVWMGWL